MGALYKRGRIWYIDVRAKGKRIRKRIGSSKKIAEMALKDAEVKIAKDEFGFTKNDIAIDKFIEQYLDYARANHQPSTVGRYRAVLDHFQRFLKAETKAAFLSEIDTETIDRYKVWRKDAWVNPNGYAVTSITPHTRKGARSHTINFEIGTLKAVFNLAIKWDYLKENPTKGVIKLKVNRKLPCQVDNS